MKTIYSAFTIISLSLTVHLTANAESNEPKLLTTDSLIVSENTIMKPQSGPHGGGGKTMGFTFFEQAKNLDMVFKKRILHKGSAIGYHQQHKDEIYYVLSGQGEYTLNNKNTMVESGMGLLTRTGDSHGLKQIGEEDLVIFIVYNKDKK